MKPEIGNSAHGEKEMLWKERWHPLREEWVIVAAHRQDRPWSGETVGRKQTAVPEYVADCYLCPGNSRVSGKKNDRYSNTFVFDNDHPCVDKARIQNRRPRLGPPVRAGALLSMPVEVIDCDRIPVICEGAALV